MFDIAIELGKSTCGSSAWCLNYLGDHAGILAHFPEEAQHDVWSRRQGRLHRHLGGADRQGRGRARRLSPQRPLVMVLGLAPFAVDHDRRARVPRGRGPSRHAALSRAGVGGEAGRHLVLRGAARHRLEHLGARRRVRARAPQRVVLDLARRPFAGLEGQHQSDLPHAVHRRAHLCAAGPRARPRPRRLCRFHGMDQAALSDLHPACHRPARSGAAQDRRDRGADRRGGVARPPGARDRAGRLHRHVDGDAHAAAPRLDLRHEDACATRWIRWSRSAGRAG